MRKYYQAALAITAAVSLISLLFYRHEYNKLRYVLEVFNYFGKPYQKDAETNCTIVGPIFNKLDLKFEEPISSWQRLDDHVYVYSAYSIREKEVQVISVTTVKNVKDIQCMLFFKNEVIPILGTFNYVPIESNSKIASNEFFGYHFLCAHARNQVPIGITFLTKSTTNLNETPILAVKNQLVQSDSNNFAVCVAPPLTRQMHSSEMLSFINYHDLISMDNFIVYDFGIPTEFNRYLREMSLAQNPYWKFTYTVLPWNFPFSGINRNTIRDIIEADCLYRTYNAAAYATTLAWEEYVVLKYHHSILDLIIDFKRSKLKTDGYRIKTLTFCTQQIDDKQTANSSLTIFRKTRFDPNIEEEHHTCIFNPREKLQKRNIYTREVGKDLIVLNRYKYCEEKENLDGSVRDTSILKFREDILNSAVYKKFISDNF